MKILCLSDLHGRLPTDLPGRDAADVVVIAGDVCPDVTYDRRANANLQRQWLGSSFAQWVDTVVRRPVVMTWGNHDVVGETFSMGDVLRELAETQYPVHLLKDEALTQNGVTFYGTPWSVTFGWWAYMQDDNDLDEVYARIPTGVDVLISHGPPYAHGDQTVDGRRVGSRSLATHIARTRPRVVVCGHIHEGRGAYRMHGTTSVYNVSYLNEAYKPFAPTYGTHEPLYRIITL